MRTLHSYLTRQVLATLLMTVAVFTFVLLLGNVLKEILSLLMNRQVTLWAVAEAVGLLIPFVLVFALPMGFLTATLLVFGRFSADNELTAARASGLSLLSLITPVVLLSVAMSCLCAIINTQVAPRCRVAYKHLLFHLGVEKLGSLLPAQTFIRDFPGWIVYLGKVNGREVENLLLYELDPSGERVVQSIQAARGVINIDLPHQQVCMQLYDVWHVSRRPKRVSVFTEEEELEPLRIVEKTEREPSLTDLTFQQLLRKRDDLESKGVVPTPVEVTINSQIAFSFACLSFTLIGIPLGIRTHRRETSIGVAIGLILVLVYYSFIILGQSLQTQPRYAPHLIVWLPNFLFQAVGGVLLWRANKGV